MIISGMARGVDTASHRSAIAAKVKASRYLAPALT
jgi:predicted Rossmann fold nucleotide-binding protein DprA/Smf involved in DNA uptake